MLVLRDSGANMVKGMHLVEMPDLSCSAHILHLVTNDGLSFQRVVVDILAKIKKTATHFDCHNSRVMSWCYALIMVCFFFVLYSPVLVSCLCIMSCCVLCFVFPCLVSCFVFSMPSCVSCPLSLSCGLPSVSLCLSALFPPGLLLCAPPLHSHLASSLLALLTCSSSCH